MDFELKADVAALVDTTRNVASNPLQFEPEFHRTGTVSNVFKAKQAVVAAYTDKTHGAKGGISPLLVTADAPGYEAMGHVSDRAALR